jgi:hypothetical protein
MAYIAVLCPLQITPYVMTAFPLLLSALTYSFFSWPIFRSIVSDDRARIVTCLLFITLPYGNFGLVSLTISTLWNLMLILICLSLITPRAGSLALVPLFVLLSALIWSHPYGIVLIPVYAYLAVRNRQQISLCIYYVGLIAVALLYFIFGIEGGGTGRGASLLGDLRSVDTFVTLLAHVSDRIIFTLALPNSLRLLCHYKEGCSILVYLGSLAIAAMIIYVVARHWQAGTRLIAVGTLVILLYLIMICTVVYLISDRVDNFLAFYGQRYYYVQKFLLVMAVVPFAVVWFQAAAKRLRVAGLAGAIALLAFNNHVSNYVYHQDLAKSAEIRRLFADLRRQEQTNGGRQNIQARLERGEWSIVIDR